MSSHRDDARRAEKNVLKKNLAQTIRRPITYSRRMEAGTDALQLPVAEYSGKSLRVTQRDIDDGLADVEDLGKYVFVIGYSNMEDGDIIFPY